MKKQVRLKPIRFKKSSEVSYRKALISLSSAMYKFIRSEIFPILKAYQSEYISDSINEELDEKFDAFKRRFFNIESLAYSISSSFVQKINRENKEKFDESLLEKLDFKSFLPEEKIPLIIKSKIEENTNLIVTQPQEYFRNISSIVYEGLVKGERASQIEKQIREQTGRLDKRIKFIARDQIAKANAALNRARQESVGVEKYEWSNSGDARVRGNPAGLYPDSKYNHWSREGKVYSWDNPPPDGHPGEAYGCRCSALPVLEIEV